MSSLSIRYFASIAGAAVFLSLANLAWTQQDTVPKKRLQPPAVATGVIGGESHAGYEIHAEKGRTMSVELTWEHAEDKRAEFTVSEFANFFDSAPVAFGRVSDAGKRWTGQVPMTGDCYVYVVAHPEAQYSLRVTVR